MSDYRGDWYFVKPTLDPEGRPLEVWAKGLDRNILPKGEVIYVDQRISRYIDRGWLEASVAPKEQVSKEKQDPKEEKLPKDEAVQKKKTKAGGVK